MAVRRSRYSQIFTCFMNCMDGVEALVEISILPGLPSVEIVGLCDSSVRESRERVRASIRQLGYEFPSARITIGIFPAYIHKSGSSFDLPLALGILMASGQVSFRHDRPIIAFGELTLTGSLRDTPGAISKLSAIANRTDAHIIIPDANRREAELLGIRADCACCLNRAVRILKGEEGRACTCHSFSSGDPQRVQSFAMNSPPVGKTDHSQDESEESHTGLSNTALDFSCLKGQPKASRAIVLAASGMHNILMTGSPGSGKTTAARVLRGLLPPMSASEKIEYLKNISTDRVLSEEELFGDSRPFRYVHQSCTAGRLLGDAVRNIPGELSRSTNGILFLDEMAEFSPRVLDMLRQPLENKCENRMVSDPMRIFPSRFLLVGAMNPCRCGRLLDNPSACTCTVSQRRQYDHKISGPLLDRIDIFCELFRLRRQGLYDSVLAESGEESERLRKEVGNCWSIQFERCKEAGLEPLLNGEVNGFFIKDLFRISHEVLEHAVLSGERMNVSARGINKIIRVARTIADIEEEMDILEHHISEAFLYRNRRTESETTYDRRFSIRKSKAVINGV
ncbi:MAG: ATP-binding protein [Clostridiaceae bacterium]|nr:ATP-binding protein [Clostridiaceae bacterium]